MKLPRFVHRWYANAFGYFWLPCPRCQTEFGGHEATMPVVQFVPRIFAQSSTERILCPNCTRKGWSCFDLHVNVDMARVAEAVKDELVFLDGGGRAFVFTNLGNQQKGKHSEGNH